MIKHLPSTDKHLLPKSASVDQWKEVVVHLMLRYVEEYGSITYNGFRGWGKPRDLARTAERVFGTWNVALTAAGLPINKKHNIGREYILNSLRRCYKENGFVTYSLFATAKYGVQAETVCRHFGDWYTAIKAAGIPLERAQRTLGKTVEAMDGHVCDSFEECLVDNYLYSRGIVHEIHKYYPQHDIYNQRGWLKTDFYLPTTDTYIEYFGLHYDNPSKNHLAKKIKNPYSKNMGRKLALVEELGMNLVCIYRKDLRNLDVILDKAISCGTLEKDVSCIDFEQ